jgi:hypothetical protein
MQLKLLENKNNPFSNKFRRTLLLFSVMRASKPIRPDTIVTFWKEKEFPDRFVGHARD